MDITPQTSQLISFVALVVVPVIGIGATSAAGYRMGWSDAPTTLTKTLPGGTDEPKLNRRKNHEADDYRDAPDWIRIAFNASIIVLLLVLAGFGSYYFAIQNVGSQVANTVDGSNTNRTVQSAELSLVEKAKQALTQKSQGNTSSTEGWKTLAPSTMGFSVIYPSEYATEPYTGSNITLPEVPGNQPKMLSLTKIYLPDGAASAPYLVIAIIENKAQFEPGAFASLFPVWNTSLDSQRTAVRVNGNASVRYTVIDSGEQIESTYIAASGSLAMYLLQLRGPTGDELVTSHDWLQFKTMISKFKIQ